MRRGTRRWPILIGVLVMATMLPFAAPVAAVRQMSSSARSMAAVATRGDIHQRLHRAVQPRRHGGQPERLVRPVRRIDRAHLAEDRSVRPSTCSPASTTWSRRAAGTGGTTPLPTPDATGAIAMSATGAKVALVSNTTLITAGTVCPVARLRWSTSWVGAGH